MLLKPLTLQFAVTLPILQQFLTLHKPLPRIPPALAVLALYAVVSADILPVLLQFVI
jgi:hypothetical protein